MVSATPVASTALGFAASQLVAVYLLWRRGEPGAPPLDSGFDFGAQETCPASCPAPSLAFCVLDPLAELVLHGAALVGDTPVLAVAASCTAFGLSVGIWIGRWVSAPRLRRPHGRRPGPPERRGRA